MAGEAISPVDQGEESKPNWPEIQRLDLDELNKMFQNRYTEEDEDYAASGATMKPPVLPWEGRMPRGGGGGRGGGGRGRGGWQDRGDRGYKRPHEDGGRSDGYRGDNRSQRGRYDSGHGNSRGDGRHDDNRGNGGGYHGNRDDRRYHQGGDDNRGNGGGYHGNRDDRRYHQGGYRRDDDRR